jgi:toxin-antitoxin system PIN domain toxin
MYLLDINVWLALAFDSHVHHPAAKAWFDALPEAVICCFCRLSQQGFLRLATNPKAVGADALTMLEAWQKYDELLSDPRVEFKPELPDLELQWRKLTQARQFSTNVWSDAYLAAFAHSSGLTLVSFDKAFSRFAGVATTIL